MVLVAGQNNAIAFTGNPSGQTDVSEIAKLVSFHFVGFKDVLKEHVNSRFKRDGLSLHGLNLLKHDRVEILVPSKRVAPVGVSINVVKQHVFPRYFSHTHILSLTITFCNWVRKDTYGCQ